MEKRGLYRQGDILLIPWARMPSSVENNKNHKRVHRTNGDVIIAEGEVTGHHHRIATKGVVMYRDYGNLYLRVPKGGAELTHEEHDTLQIPQGVYRVGNQREYRAQAAPARVYD